MPKLSVELLDKLRKKVSLELVASRKVRWDSRKSNSEKGDYWGPCPFHDDAGSAFHVDDRKSFYYCFGCHEKGDQISFLMKDEGIDFEEAVRKLAFIARLEHLLVKEKRMSLFPTIIDLKDFMVEHFLQENFLEIGILTGWSSQIQGHPRLLRSLSWGDPDYAGNVLEILSSMSMSDPSKIRVIENYILKKFPSEAAVSTGVQAYAASERSLGYKYTAPRNDRIGVMMPFAAGFTQVYDAIKNACATTSLTPQRADEVWNNSTVINDILEIINHSAVVICDLTGRNENVFYELGIAHAWGKPVIPITQHEGDVPFDLKHHRYLKYLNNDEGRRKLTEDLGSRLRQLVDPAPGRWLT